MFLTLFYRIFDLIWQLQNRRALKKLLYSIFDKKICALCRTSAPVFLLTDYFAPRIFHHHTAHWNHFEACWEMSSYGLHFPEHLYYPLSIARGVFNTVWAFSNRYPMLFRCCPQGLHRPQGAFSEIYFAFSLHFFPSRVFIDIRNQRCNWQFVRPYVEVLIVCSSHSNYALSDKLEVLRQSLQIAEKLPGRK